MKYVWLVALLLVMAGTWFLGTPEHVTDLTTLTQRQDEFASLIRNSVHEAQPDATEVNFSKLYLETVKADQVLRAHFRYQIVTAAREASEGAPAVEGVSQTVEGTSLLRSEDGGQTWHLTQTDLNEPAIEFSSGVTISPQKDGAEPELKQ